MLENVTLAALEASVTLSISVYVGVAIYFTPYKEIRVFASRLVSPKSSKLVIAAVLRKAPESIPTFKGSAEAIPKKVLKVVFFELLLKSKTSQTEAA